MWKEQKEILDNFYKRYGKFRVAAHTQWGWRYETYPSDMALYLLQRDDITDRDIMKDEIVIENDLNMLRMNSGESIRHEKKLRNNGIAYKKYFSGNKSFHIHTQFKELMKIKNEYDLKLLKKSFLLWLYKFNEDEVSNHKLDIQLSGKHLIRLEEAWHPQTMQRKTLYNEHETDENKIPYIVKEKYKEILQKEKLMEKQMEKIYNIVFDERPCIIDLYTKPLNDGRHRAAFILFNVFKKQFGTEKAGNMLLEWYEKIVKPTSVGKTTLSEGVIRSYIQSYSQHYKSPGCKYIRDFMISIGKRDIIKRCPCSVFYP